MQENGYSKFVAYAKVLLPLAALALLSTLFLLARGRTDPTDVPLDRIETLAREQILSAPSITGMTPEEVAFAVSAKEAKPNPDNPEIFAVEQIALDFDAPSGLSLDIRGGVGVINVRTQFIELQELARVTSSNGYQMETAGLTADVPAGHVESTAPLEVRAPYGNLTAGHLVVQSTAEGMQIVFNQGVRLVYQPQFAEGN